MRSAPPTAKVQAIAPLISEVDRLLADILLVAFDPAKAPSAKTNDIVSRRCISNFALQHPMLEWLLRRGSGCFACCLLLRWR